MEPRTALENLHLVRDGQMTAYLFSDRLEIVTPGGLPAGMREEDLGDKSVPRNRLLFGMLHRMGVVEEIGSGIRRIRQECLEYGVAAPVIEVSENWVTTTFRRPDAPLAGTGGGAGTGMRRPPPPADRGPRRHQVGTKSAPSRHFA